MLASGIDPIRAKREERAARATVAESTFETVARTWLARTAANRAATSQEKNSSWLEKNVFPSIGRMPVSEIGRRDVLAALQKIEARGALESAHRIWQLCGLGFGFAVAGGLVERDVAADLRGTLPAVPKAHFAAITEPARAGALLRSIHGHSYAAAALKLFPMLFVRPDESGLIGRQPAHAACHANGLACKPSHLPARRAMMQRRADYLDQIEVWRDKIVWKFRTVDPFNTFSNEGSASPIPTVRYQVLSTRITATIFFSHGASAVTRIAHWEALKRKLI